MVSGVPIGELDDKTRRRLGLPVEPGDEPVSESIVILGKVLNVLKTLSKSNALWVLREAEKYVSRQGFKDEPAAAGDGYRPSMDSIVNIVAQVFEFEPSLLKGRRRDRMVAEARQVAMYVLDMTNRFTMREIGRCLGGRDHATVSNGCQVITRRLQVDGNLRNKLMQINDRI